LRACAGPDARSIAAILGHGVTRLDRQPLDRGARSF